MSSQIDQVLSSAAAAGQVPGIVAMAQKAGGPVYQGAFGVRALDDPAPMTVDTVFRIASMTKAVTSTAAMQQVERGTLSLDTPVADLVPEWAGKQVLEGWDGETPILRPARTTATVRNLATHTAGSTYEWWSEGHARYMGTGHTSLLAGLKKGLQAPLAFDPGTGWIYGDNIDWLGLCVEAASGQKLDEYFADNILGPAGMTETRFLATTEQRGRLAKVHMRDESGALAATEMDWPQSPEWWAGGHGLYSVAGDYMKFLDIFRNGGKAADGTQVVKPETIKVMTSDQSGGHPMVPLVSQAPPISNTAEFFPGSPKVHSTAFQINLEDQPGMRAAGSLAWAGIFNSFYWWDPANDVTGTILMQLLPFADVEAMAIFTDFEKAVYASL